MTNEEKAVGLSLQVRDLCIEKGVTKDNAETASLLVQQTALQMAKWKDEQYAEVLARIAEANEQSKMAIKQIRQNLEKMYKINNQ